jgi:hypothetical protein
MEVSEYDQVNARLADAELIKRFVTQQDQQAFADLVLRFQGALLKYVTRLCKGDD